MWVRTREKSGTPLGRAIRGSGRPSWHDQKVFWTLCPLPETIFHFKVSPDTCKPELRDTVLQEVFCFHSSLYPDLRLPPFPPVPLALKHPQRADSTLLLAGKSFLRSYLGASCYRQSVPPSSPICLTARITQIFNRTIICAASCLRKASQSC